jgi:hypothetical protein
MVRYHAILLALYFGVQGTLQLHNQVLIPICACSKHAMTAKGGTQAKCRTLHISAALCTYTMPHPGSMKCNEDRNTAGSQTESL